MKQIFKNQFFVAIIIYIFIVVLITIPVFYFLQKIKIANQENQVQLSDYQGLKIKENRFTGDYSKITCDGNLFSQAGVPITAIYADQKSLYISQTNNKLVIFDFNQSISKQPAEYNIPVLADLYSNASGFYGADFFNDEIVKLIFVNGEIIAKQYYPKIGRASAVTMDSKGLYYASGYASGNITKIVGRDGFLLTSDLDKIVDLEASGAGNLLVARNNSKPTLINLDLNNKNKIIIENERSTSSLVFDGDSFWAAYDSDGKSYIGKIIGNKLIDDQVVNCSFPLKIAVSSDKIFYTSIKDSEGKVYWINKNLPNIGR